MKDKVIKPGAYVILIAGIIVSLTLALIGLGILLSYPEAVLYKKISVVAAVLIIATTVVLAAIAAFESMMEVTQMGDELKELEDELKSKGKK